jgi:hypothetical protein
MQIKTINQDTVVRSLEKDFADNDDERKEFTFGMGLEGLWEEPLDSDAGNSFQEQISPNDELSSQQEAIKKIASLEAELSKLRTQIANYALNHVDLDDTQLPCEHKAVSHMQHVYFVYTYVYILYLCTYVRMYVRTVLCISYIIVCL